MEYSYIIPDELAYLGRSSVGDRDDLDKLCICEVSRRGRRKPRVNVHIPFGRQPSQDLQRGYGSSPDGSPLGAIDILGVALF